MEAENTRGGGLSFPPLLPFGMFVGQTIARSNTNPSCVCPFILKVMMADIPVSNCRMLFLSRLVLGVSRMSFNSWAIHLARTEEIRASVFIIRGGRRKGKVMQCVCMYARIVRIYLNQRIQC